ncbi:protease complex subunit PrcB family protein [Marinimicrobium locisalis]|uniref:protease complex subunit PrcB family protein n=1 Tax=Marinimicrobium locisalis TaxID=546022 RepID=UPI00322191E5
MTRLSVIGCSLLLSLSFSSAWAGGSCGKLSVETLTSGFYNQYVTEKRYVPARTEAEVEELEKLVGTSFDVDLSEQMVLGAFMGQRNSGGYSIEVTKAWESDEALHVKVLLTSPGPTCPVTLAITSPYEVVALPAVDKELEVHERTEVRRCR